MAPQEKRGNLFMAPLEKTSSDCSRTQENELEENTDFLLFLKSDSSPIP